MIPVGNTLVSLDVIEQHFVCHLEKCKGACCIEGDSGAPLRAEEVTHISAQLEHIRPFMDEQGLELLDQRGFHEPCVHDTEPVTTCRNDGACVFVKFDKLGIAKCAVEESWRAGKSSVMKPLSCHLYPVRLVEVGEFTGLNYHQWSICSAACSLGNSLQVPLYVFLKDALIRAFGAEWYAELEEIAAAWKQSS